MQIARGAILLSFFHYSVCVKSAPIGLKSEPTQQQCLFITFFSAPFPTFLLLPRKNTSERSYFAKLFSKIFFFNYRVVLSDSFIVNLTSAKTWRTSKKKPSDIKVHISGATVSLKIAPSSKKTILFVQKTYCP